MLGGAGLSSRPPRLRTILLLVAFVLVALPLGALTSLRIAESELARRTQSELVAQGAVLGAAYRAALGEAVDDGKIAPVEADLDLSTETVHPPAGPPPPTDWPASDRAVQAGESLIRVVRLASRVTLAGIRITDAHGTIVASTGNDIGRSLLHQSEVVDALQGRPSSLLRERITDRRIHVDFDTPSRVTQIRVFVALPIMNDGEVLGAVALSRTPISLQRAVYEHRRNVIIGVVLALAIAAGLAIFTALMIVRPMSRLVRQALQIGAGDREGLTPIRRPATAEVAALSEALADTASKLLQRTEYVETFANNVSHAFKTPLTSIRGAVELLKDHAMSEEETARFLDIIERDTTRMQRLVSRLLEMAKADVAGPKDATTNVSTLVDRVAARYRQDDMEIETSHGESVEAAIPPEALEAVLENLLDNAREHAPGATVAIETTPGRIRVADTGPGVPDGLDVFAPFVTTAGDAGGTGLGLPIVRALLRAHGGDVDYVKGAFVIELRTSGTSPRT